MDKINDMNAGAIPHDHPFFKEPSPELMEARRRRSHLGSESEFTGERKPKIERDANQTGD